MGIQHSAPRISGFSYRSGESVPGCRESASGSARDAIVSGDETTLTEVCMKNMRPITIDEQLNSIRRLPLQQRLEAEAALRRGEVIGNLVLGAARLIRRAAAGVTRAGRRGAQAHLKPYAGEIYR
jgi:hypothetical protein